jgi:hypothetical protein
VLGLAVFAVYSVVASIGWASRRAAAQAHAHSVFALERRLSIDIEPALNHWLAPHRVLRTLANYEYATTYVLAAFALLFWLYIRRPDVYRWARNSFVLLNLAGVACFALYPLMPPRLLGSTEGVTFVDTVLRGRTWGSWGSPLVGHANQLAAMPSLHVGWALWVSVVLAVISEGWRTQLLSAVHVVLTFFVVVATANHFVLDGVGAAVLVGLCVAVTGRRPGRREARVPTADAFFLHVESASAPQHVGGVVLLDTASRPGGPPSRQEVEDRVRFRLDELPRFRQRLTGGGRWRRPRWEDAPDLDWSWHVPLVDLSQPDGSPGGMCRFHALVADLAAERLPQDRPLWRLVVVHGVDAGTSAVVLIVHHVVADGIGTVAQALRLLEPDLPALFAAGAERGPGRLRRALAIVVGLAQLATDGRPSGTLPSSGTAERRFGTMSIPLDAVRDVARRSGVRVSDVLLCGVASATRQALLSTGATPPDQLRVSVPLIAADPRQGAEGNVTAAVLLDVPLTDVPESQRLAAIAAQTARLRTPTRALASRFVMNTLTAALPVPAQAWFARTVYGSRFFSAIVSNMPGPEPQLSLVGAPLMDTFPLLPLAPGVPLAIGTLGWHGNLCTSIAADPALTGDADAFGAAVRDAIEALAVEPGNPGAVRAADRARV